MIDRSRKIILFQVDVEEKTIFEYYNTVENLWNVIFFLYEVRGHTSPNASHLNKFLVYFEERFMTAGISSVCLNERKFVGIVQLRWSQQAQLSSISAT